MRCRLCTDPAGAMQFLLMPPTELPSVRIAAPYTPLRADGAPNLPVIDRPAYSLIANNVSGAFACVTTGSVRKVVVEILL